MPRTALSYLVLPRLHPELLPPLPLPEGALLLWPGLPRPPQSGVFLPAWPWSPAQAAACVDDFERAGRDGAAGAPVVSLWAAGPGLADELSAGERQALRQFMEQAPRPASSKDSPNQSADKFPDNPAANPAEEEARRKMRQTAQQTLLLAWVQERQALELRDLKRRARRERAALAGLLGEGNPALLSPEPPESAHQAPDPLPLPPWRAVLAAAALFLPPAAPATAPAASRAASSASEPSAFSEPSASSVGEYRDMAVLALDRDMAECLAALAEPGHSAPFSPPPGFRGARLPLNRVLGRAWSAGRNTAPEAAHDILFLWPAAWPSDRSAGDPDDPAARPGARI